MRRADRLFEIVQMLRGGRLRTAAEIAARLEVSVRTVYRDVDALVASGVPIEGERGVGYVIRVPLLLPPLSFTAAELQALALGARFVRAWGDDELLRAAEEALVKIDAVLPADRRGELDRRDLDAFAMRHGAAERDRLGLLRRALRARRKVRLRYTDGGGGATERLVRPLSLESWGHTWTLTAWCELRADFRAFRLDRMAEAAATDELFRPEPGRTLEDYHARLRAEGWAVARR
ncbi:MAG TPA: YafY family protein [Alphaproteobacteria bacterium]|nr:YafY family protein [Alphaproteobacteria bacterium]